MVQIVKLTADKWRLKIAAIVQRMIDVECEFYSKDKSANPPLLGRKMNQSTITGAAKHSESRSCTIWLD